MDKSLMIKTLKIVGIIIIGIIVIGAIYLITKKAENFQNSNNNCPVEMTDATALDAKPKSILKKAGTKSLPKKVHFEEFDVVNTVELPSRPWCQGDVITKYDPKFVNVFETRF